MSGGSGSNRNECRIYVGNLPPDIRTKDIQDLFYKFGKVTFVDLKNRKGPPFAFVEFEDPRDADDAVRARDGYDYDGYRLRVEFPRGGGGGGRGARGGGGGDRFPRGAARGPPARRSEFRVLVTGLPPSGSWQDLKDHMREAGDVCFADTFKDGTGVVEFLRHEDMKYAVKKLDDSRFRSHEVRFLYVKRVANKAYGPPDRLPELYVFGVAESKYGAKIAKLVDSIGEEERRQHQILHGLQDAEQCDQEKQLSITWY
ncbi:hypothetical protein evm_012282 [Chilo suppressalis]|nr:hypothetical protein evm_012282 [Chilo suppressalis]